MPRGRQRRSSDRQEMVWTKNDITDKRRKKILERNDIERYEKKIKNWGNFVKENIWQKSSIADVSVIVLIVSLAGV